MYAYCEIIERVSTPRGRHGTGSTSVVRYWHVFPASTYWDQVKGEMVYGQTKAYRYSDTPDRHYTETPQYLTRAERSHAAQLEITEYLRTGIPRYAREGAQAA